MNLLDKIKSRWNQISDYILESFSEMSLVADEPHNVLEELGKQEITSFSVNGEGFILDTGSISGFFDTVGYWDINTTSNAPYISDIAWKEPKYVWEWEKGCEKMQSDILKVIENKA